MIALRICLVASALILAGCSEPVPGFFSGTSTERAQTEVAVVTDAQACAIGYDLARSLYDNLPAGRTDIVVREGQGPCERHAINYLRRAGFAIRKTGGSAFTVETRAMSADTVLAVARVGTRHSVSRLYELGPAGVYAASPASFQHIQNRPEPVRRQRRRTETLPAASRVDP